jgi:hypothetical protein
MSKLQSITQGNVTIEFWKCENCGSVRRVDPANVHQIFQVEPDFCNARCKRAYQVKHHYVPAGQLSLLESEV